MYHITITEKSTGAVLMDSDSDSIIGVVNRPDCDSTRSISAIHTDGRTLKANILALLSLASTVSRIAGASGN